MTAFRCATASQAEADPLAGTASTVSAWLLVEVAGPWGVDALRDSRLPAPVRSWLGDLEGRHGVRALLVRRPGRPSGGPPRVFAATSGAEGPRLETAVLADHRELLELDLRGLRAGGSAGLTGYDGPLLLVCTHGRHDPCCAERGRPLAAALAAVAPEQTWEVSHIGGDRFAGNVVVLPDGHYYGRLTPADAAPFAANVRAGRLDLEHLRGRSSYAFAVQAADIALRRHLGERRVDAVRYRSASRAGSATTVELEAAGARWRLEVHREAGAERPLTCRAVRSAPPVIHRVVSLRRVAP